MKTMNRWLLSGLMVASLPACKEQAPAPTAPAPGATSPAATAPAAPAPLSQWETDNPVMPLPKPPLGVEADWKKVPWVTAEKVRLGKWLYYDKRLSADATIACASCHHPENAFSETTPVSTGIKGQKGTRKAPSFVNAAWPLAPFYFWDGRAASLAEQAKGPINNPIEMGNTHEAVVSLVTGLAGYKKAFKEAFGDDKIDIDRVAEAIAAYEATRMSGNSPYDKFQAGDKTALSDKAQKGKDLYFGKALCGTCHLGWNLTDSQFHNLGIGWDEAKAKKAGKDKEKLKAAMADPGRAKISNKDEDTGAFKTPTVRDVALHAPYMHDGSLKTLKDVMDHYNKGGHKNPWLDARMVPLKLTAEEIDQVVAFMESLTGEGYQDKEPASFPQ